MILNYKQMLLGLAAFMLFGVFVSTNEVQIAIAGILYVCFLQMQFIKKEDHAGKRIMMLLCLLLVVGVLVGVSLLMHSMLFEGELISGTILLGLTAYGALCLIVGMMFMLLQEFLSKGSQKVVLIIGLMYLIVLTSFTKDISMATPDSFPVENNYQPPWDLIGIAFIFFVIGCVLECVISHMKHKPNETESLDI